jgi:hypothetical protein
VRRSRHIMIIIDIFDRRPAQENTILRIMSPSQAYHARSMPHVTNLTFIMLPVVKVLRFRAKCSTFRVFCENEASHSREQNDKMRPNHGQKRAAAYPPFSALLSLVILNCLFIRLHKRFRYYQQNGPHDVIRRDVKMPTDVFCTRVL